MCTYSMVVDWRYDTWQPYIQQTRVPSQEEILEFYELLKRARKYDKENHEPDCELEGKKEKLRTLAKELGVEIEFKD